MISIRIDEIPFWAQTSKVEFKFARSKLKEMAKFLHTTPTYFSMRVASNGQFVYVMWNNKKTYQVSFNMNPQLQEFNVRIDNTVKIILAYDSLQAIDKRIKELKIDISLCSLVEIDSYVIGHSLYRLYGIDKMYFLEVWQN